MSLLFWIVAFAANSTNAEQIKLYFVLLWVLHAILFVVGSFAPGARALLMGQ